MWLTLWGAAGWAGDVHSGAVGWGRTMITNVQPGQLHEFYRSSAWERLRAEVLAEYKYECQHCKARGYYTKANTVHHVRHVKRYPELALSKTYTDGQGYEQQNLVPLCHACHEQAHDHRQKEKPKPLTKERW